jgi:hypothetical protein
VVEEFGRGSQCTKAGLLHKVFSPMYYINVYSNEKLTRNDLMVSTARMAVSMFEASSWEGVKCLDV